MPYYLASSTNMNPAIDNSASYLLSLPVELVRRIASFLPCTSALSLMTASRTLRSTCNDRLLFREIAERTTTSNSITKDEEWQDASVLLCRASLSDTIRIAYAVERATKRGEVEYPLWEMQNNGEEVDSDVRSWLPHLVALRHPTCLTFRPEHLLCLHYQLSRFQPERSSQYYADLLGVEFCIIALVLQQIAWGEDFYRAFSKQWKKIMESREAERKRDVEIAYLLGLHDINPGPSPGITLSLSERVHRLPTNTYGQASAIILHMPFFIDGMHAVNDLPVPLPELSRMPFHTWMNIPMVYGSERRDFNECHAWWATTPQFISGTWMGYYSDERGQEPNLEEPMHNINLIARKPDLPYSTQSRIRTVIDAASEGCDGIGKFALHGEIHFDGSVILYKQYYQGWEWIYKGFVTPFGIAGSWGDRNLDGKGYFWLWKKDWCNPEASHLE
jgi:hypothetical protein